MARDGKKARKTDKSSEPEDESKEAGAPPDGKLSYKDYEKALMDLHVELLRLQEWVLHKGLKVCVVFEGRDGAGKGGTIKAITERVSPGVLADVESGRGGGGG